MNRRSLIGFGTAGLAVVLGACNPDTMPSAPLNTASAPTARSWEWQSQGAFPKTLVLTLYRDRGARLESWGPLTAAGDTPYRVVTGAVRWAGRHELVVFYGGRPAPLEIRTAGNGRLDAWWYPDNSANLLLDAAIIDRPATVPPDMEMRDVALQPAGTRPVDVP